MPGYGLNGRGSLYANRHMYGLEEASMASGIVAEGYRIYVEAAVQAKVITQNWKNRAMRTDTEKLAAAGWHYYDKRTWSRTAAKGVQD